MNQKPNELEDYLKMKLFSAINSLQLSPSLSHHSVDGLTSQSFTHGSPNVFELKIVA